MNGKYHCICCVDRKERHMYRVGFIKKLALEITATFFSFSIKPCLKEWYDFLKVTL